MRFRVVRRIMSKSTEFVHRIADMGEGHGTTLTYVCPHCLRFLAEDHIRWITQEHGDSGKKQEEAVWLVVCGVRVDPKIVAHKSNFCCELM